MAPTYHLLPYPFWIAFAGTDNLNHQPGQHRHSGVVAVNELEVCQKPIKGRRHDGDVLGIKDAAVFLFYQSDKRLERHATVPRLEPARRRYAITKHRHTAEGDEMMIKQGKTIPAEYWAHPF
jgi:hypothetical protein